MSVTGIAVFEREKLTSLGLSPNYVEAIIRLGDSNLARASITVLERHNEARQRLEDLAEDIPEIHREEFRHLNQQLETIIAENEKNLKNLILGKKTKQFKDWIETNLVR